MCSSSPKSLLHPSHRPITSPSSSWPQERAASLTCDHARHWNLIFRSSDACRCDAWSWQPSVCHVCHLEQNFHRSSNREFPPQPRIPAPLPPSVNFPCTQEFTINRRRQLLWGRFAPQLGLVCMCTGIPYMLYIYGICSC